MLSTFLDETCLSFVPSKNENMCETTVWGGITKRGSRGGAQLKWKVLSVKGSEKKRSRLLIALLSHPQRTPTMPNFWCISHGLTGRKFCLLDWVKKKRKKKHHFFFFLFQLHPNCVTHWQKESNLRQKIRWRRSKVHILARAKKPRSPRSLQKEFFMRQDIVNVFVAYLLRCITRISLFICKMRCTCVTFIIRPHDTKMHETRNKQQTKSSKTAWHTYHSFVS